MNYIKPPMKPTEQQLKNVRREALDCYEVYVSLRAAVHDAADKSIMSPEPLKAHYFLMEKARKAFSAYTNARLGYDLAYAAYESESAQ
jgi:hypothetical protein